MREAQGGRQNGSGAGSRLLTPTRRDVVLGLTIACTPGILGASSLSADCIPRPSGNRFSALSFGASGDGIQDDAPALEAAVAFASANGGGIVELPAGTYLLRDLAESTRNPRNIHIGNVPEAFVKARDNVWVRGAGERATILKIAPGTIERLPGLNIPNVFATSERGALANFHLSDLTVDWNGNVNRSDRFWRRQNSTLATRYSVRNCSVRNITVLNGPGSNNIYIENGFGEARVVRGSGFGVSECSFINSGSAAPLNHMPDTTDVYVEADHVRIEHNRFLADRRMMGACYEFHGAENLAVGNRSRNYDLSWWIVENLGSNAGTSLIRDEVHEDLWFNAFSLTGTTRRSGTVIVRDSLYRLHPEASFPVFPNENAETHPFINVSSGHADRLQIERCRFYGNNHPRLHGFFYRFIDEVVFANNYMEGFLSPAAGYGVLTVPAALPEAPQLNAKLLAIHDNEFLNVARPISLWTGEKKIRHLRITGNSFRVTRPANGPPVYTEMASAPDSVRLSGNAFEGWSGQRYRHVGARLPGL